MEFENGKPKQKFSNDFEDKEKKKMVNKNKSFLHCNKLKRKKKLRE